MTKYQLGDWVVDSSRGLLLDGDEAIKVEPKCMDLLVLLIRANGDLVSRQTIMDSLWQGRYVSDHALNNIVAMLRKYLNNSSGRNYITTQPKRGYILSEPVLKLDTVSQEDEEYNQQENSSKKLDKISALSMIGIAFVIAIIIIRMVVLRPINDKDKDTSIVVFPFDAINSDDSLAIFIEGLSEEINHQLSSNTRLTVLTHSMIPKVEADKLSNQSVAQQLNVNYFVEGSVRAEQNLLRVTTRLVNGKTGTQLWSKVYTANKKDMISSQYSVSRQLTKIISVSLETADVLADPENSSPLHLLRGSKRSASGTDEDSLTSNASTYFLSLAKQLDPSQSITNEWQIGMYNNSVFELFEYSATTVLGRPSIAGWVNRGFHAGFLNISDQDEVFPGTVFKAGALGLHPGDNSAEVVLRYLVQQDGDYEISGHFFALDTIECLKCTSDGVNVSVRVNGKQLDESQDITGFGETTKYQVTGSNISLQQGDVVDFIVMPRSTFFDDATVITADVSRGN